MGLFSSSSKSSTTSNVTNLADNTNISENEGVAIKEAAGDVTILTADPEIARAAFAFGDAAFGTVEKSLGTVSGAYSDAAAYQAKALSTVADIADTSQRSSLGFFNDAFEGIMSFVGNLQSKAQDQIGSTVTALNQIARESSKSTDERVAEISAGAQRTTLIVVGMVAAAAVLYSIFKR